MWKPFEPEVLTQLGRPSSSSRSRSASAPSRSVGVVVVRRVEVEDADVGALEARHARGPDVRRDAVLVGEPQQRSAVADQRVVDRAALLRHLDALQPGREALHDVLLQEALRADARREALHRDRAAARCAAASAARRLVVGGQLALGDAVVGEQHLLGMGDRHGRSRTTSRGVLSVAQPEQARMAQLAVRRPLDEGRPARRSRPHPVRAQARQADRPW